MTAWSPDDYAADFVFGLTLFDMARERSRQADARLIGVSDIGVCHEQTRRMLKGLPDSDSTPRMQAMMGTFADEGFKAARKAQNPDLIVDSVVSITLPSSGVQIQGHPDEIDLDEPSVTDYKTKDADGLAYIRRNHSPDHHRYQRHLYGLGAIQTGLVTAEGLIVRNIYVDRSGKDDTPHVEQEPFDMAVVAEAEEWLRDVLYAVEHDELAYKDKHVSWCRQWCQFATACRGMDLPTSRFTDPEVVQAALTFDEINDTYRDAKRVRDHAKKILNENEVNGIAGDIHIRRTWVNGAADGSRKGYWKVTADRLPESELSATDASASTAPSVSPVPDGQQDERGAA